MKKKKDNLIDAFINKEYTTVEAIYLVVFMLGSVSLLSFFVGRIAYTGCGIVFLSIGIYGFIRKYWRKK